MGPSHGQKLHLDLLIDVMFNVDTGILSLKSRENSIQIIKMAVALSFQQFGH